MIYFTSFVIRIQKTSSLLCKIVSKPLVKQGIAATRRILSKESKYLNVREINKRSTCECAFWQKQKPLAHSRREVCYLYYDFSFFSLEDVKFVETITSLSAFYFVNSTVRGLYIVVWWKIEYQYVNVEITFWM